MTMLLDDISNVLLNASVAGGITSWGLFKSYMPDAPDNSVCVYETGGVEADQSDDTRYDRVSFQVKVRAATYSYEDARNKIAEVFNALNDASVPGYVYVFASTGAPLSMGYDETNRPSLVWNFEALKER